MIKVTIRKKDAEHASKTGFDPVDVAISRRVNCSPENIELVGNRIECYENDSMIMLYTISDEDKELMKETSRAWNYSELDIDEIDSLKISFKLKKEIVEDYYA